jgi:hypothetical protein
MAVSQEKECFSLGILLRLCECLLCPDLFLLLPDPSFFLPDETLNGLPANPQRRTYDKPAIPLNDQGDRPAPRSDELIDLHHASIISVAHPPLPCQLPACITAL